MIPRIATLTALSYAAYLTAETTAVAAADEEASWAIPLGFLLVVLAPTLGLVLLTRRADNRLAKAACSFLVLTCLGGTMLVYHGLHVAPPDPLNLLSVLTLALLQLAGLAALGLFAAIRRWLHQPTHPSQDTQC